MESRSQYLTRMNAGRSYFKSSVDYVKGIILAIYSFLYLFFYTMIFPPTGQTGIAARPRGDNNGNYGGSGRGNYPGGGGGNSGSGSGSGSGPGSRFSGNSFRFRGGMSR